MTLTKSQSRSHLQALKLLKNDVLTIEERIFVIENYHEAADTNNRASSAHFTPMNLAFDLQLEICSAPRLIDFCAGIGTLAFAHFCRLFSGHSTGTVDFEIVCIEINPVYVAIGKKILPEATWICGSIFDASVQEQIAGKKFDCSVSNPPFGRFACSEKAPTYKGPLFEYKVIDLASKFSSRGVFIIPAASAPFRQRGRGPFIDYMSSDQSFDGSSPTNLKAYKSFNEQTGLVLQHNLGIDCDFYIDDWKTVKPSIEITCVDFGEEVFQCETSTQGQFNLFQMEA